MKYVLKRNLKIFLWCLTNRWVKYGLRQDIFNRFRNICASAVPVLVLAFHRNPVFLWRPTRWCWRPFRATTLEALVSVLLVRVRYLVLAGWPRHRSLFITIRPAASSLLPPSPRSRIYHSAFYIVHITFLFRQRHIFLFFPILSLCVEEEFCASTVARLQKVDVESR